MSAQAPATALWAAADCWPDLADALLVEASPALRACGEALAAEAGLPRSTWRGADVACGRHRWRAARSGDDGLCAERACPGGPAAVSLERLWQATADTLVIVEPGTPAGWQRILAARRQLIESGAHVIAPCPHAHDCPLRGAGLVPFRGTRRPLPAASASQRRCGAVGRREVQLCGAVAKASACGRRARHCLAAKGQRPCHAEALPCPTDRRTNNCSRVATAKYSSAPRAAIAGSSL